MGASLGGSFSICFCDFFCDCFAMFLRFFGDVFLGPFLCGFEWFSVSLNAYKIGKNHENKRFEPHVRIL